MYLTISHVIIGKFSTSLYVGSRMEYLLIVDPFDSILALSCSFSAVISELMFGELDQMVRRVEGETEQSTTRRLTTSSLV